ncbi:MAG: hypothetical protein V4496_05370 [Pseudomonadota bacterium]
MKYSKLLLGFLAVSALATGNAESDSYTPPCTLGAMCYLTPGQVSYFEYQQAGDYVCALSVPSHTASSATADLHMGSAAKFKPVVVTSGTPVRLHAEINAQKGSTGQLKFELQAGQSSYQANEVGVQCALLANKTS